MRKSVRSVCVCVSECVCVCVSSVQCVSTNPEVYVMCLILLPSDSKRSNTLSHIFREVGKEFTISLQHELARPLSVTACRALQASYVRADNFVCSYVYKGTIFLV